MFDNMQELMKRNRKVVEALQYAIDREDLECADNYRIAKRDDSWQRVAYDEAISFGCCGSFDTVVVVDGVEWMVGCNYGH